MTFLSHIRSYGLICDYAIPNCKFNRTYTNDKPRGKKNGAYIFDGIKGSCIDFASGMEWASWRDGSNTYIDTSKLRAERHASKVAAHKRRIEAVAEATNILRLADVITPRKATKWKDGVVGHPYLIAKGFPEHTFLSYRRDLIVPMRSLSGDLMSVQKISPEGHKLFLTGGQAKGAVHWMGPAKHRTVWLCEGYATGLSVKRALQDMYSDAPVVVCFSAGNLKHIASLGVGTHVMADNDVSGAGQDVARATGLPWVMPEVEGSDANDLHRAEGLRAVVRTMQRLEELAVA